jgi:S1-C subfamily serine protease
MKFGSVQRAYMGIEYLDSKTAAPEQVKALGLDRNEGVYVLNVLANSGAAASGIKKGDIITHVNGQVVSTQPQLQEQIARYTPGDNVNVTYLRDGKAITTMVKLNKAEMPATLLGASFRALTAQERGAYGVQGGVVVTDPGKGALARQTQMHKGFVITGVNDQPVTTVPELQTLLGKSKNLQLSGFQPGYQGMYYYNMVNPDMAGDHQ